MFSRQKPPTAKKRNHDLSQFGLMEIPDDFDPTGGLGDDENDSDLEAELAALSSGGGAKAKPKAKPKPTLVPAADLDKMIADSLKDVPSDDDDDDDVDENELMGELKNIAGDVADELVEEEDSTPQAVETFLPTTTINTAGIIQQRIELYKQAEAQAKDAGETAKVRRLGRGLKTLQELLKKAATGQAINVDDIPPEVSIKGAKPATEQNTKTEPTTPPSVPARAAPPPPSPIRAAPPTPKAEEVEAAAKPQNPLLDTMLARQREYKEAALQAKRSGEMSNALQFLKVVKQFDIVMDMVKNGQEVDMSDMPPAPAEFAAFMAKMQQGASSDTPAQAPAAAAPPTAVAAAKPSTPTSILEALQQRLDKYKSVETAAKEENNASKARRYNRIVKQYEDAIKQQKAGKPVAYDELPVPPGFEPLTSSIAAASTETSTPSTETTPASSPQAVTRPQRVSPPADLTTRTSGNLQRNNLAEQQMKILVERQSEFKKAAIEAKKAGEMQQAKEYLKIFKGFDALLNAASSGLPVDLTTLPVPPSQRDNLEASFAIVNAEDGEVANDDISDIGVRLEEQLAKQLMMCKNTRDHHKAMGDIAGMNRFENLALAVQKDLDLLRYSKRQNLPLPKFHYEKRSFNIVHCNTDLRDDELEIMIVRGINYVVPNPKDVDTYVKIEFPLLNEEFFRAKSNLIKDTNSPDYNQRFSVEIQRNNRQFQRFFKRHGVKFEVYSRGGFLRSDVLIGTVNVKLQPLETKCDIHDTFDLMEGRRAVGGKLEVKLRLRNPILAKQMEHIDEKWLVLDS